MNKLLTALSLITMIALMGCNSTPTPVAATINNSATTCTGVLNGSGAMVITCTNGDTATIPAADVAALSTGPAGPQGAQGPQGAAGTNGTNGVSGAQGATGATGAQGTAGTNGTNGTNGSNGTNAAQLVAKTTGGVTINAIVTGKSNTLISLWDNNNNFSADYDATGKIIQENIYWNGANCTGTPYIALPPQTVAPAPGLNYLGVQAVFGDNSGHIYNTINQAVITTELGYMSMQTAYAGACNSYGSTQYYPGVDSMQAQTYVGGVLPTAIELPLTVN